MVHASYEIEKANGWWGPAPELGTVAVAVREGPDLHVTFLTIVDRRDGYEVLSCTHPKGERLPRSVVQDLRVEHYSPGLDEEVESSNDLSFEEPYVRERTAFVHAAAKTRHSYGLDNLHYLAEGIRCTLQGQRIERRAKEAMNEYGQLQRMYTSTKYPYELLPTSPFAPYGLWTYVAPDHPFDLRIRAQCTIAKVTKRRRPLETLALRAIDIRKLGDTELLSSTDHHLFKPLADGDRCNDDP